jgi:hypothetical protein
MRKLLFLTPVLLVVACSSLSLSDRLYLSCNGYVTVLGTLAKQRAAGHLSDSVIARVDNIRSIANPICSSAIANNETINTLEKAISEMIAIKDRTDG